MVAWSTDLSVDIWFTRVGVDIRVDIGLCNAGHGLRCPGLFKGSLRSCINVADQECYVNVPCD